MTSATVGPLAGVRVVELGVWVAGPAAGGILADWGADVVKVEPPSGDPARSFNRMLGGDMPTNPPFELDNRSKRSVVLDLTTSRGLQVFWDLLAKADVLLTNIRSSALQRLGIDPEDVRARCPHLVIGLVTGYGLVGPDADRAAYDVGAYWARSGIASLLRSPDGALPFQRGAMGDHAVAMTAAAMVCAALISRQRTGEGQLVTTSLLRQGVYTIGFDLNVTLLWGKQISQGSREKVTNPAMNYYTAADGREFWIIGMQAGRHWPPLARVVGRPEWLEEGSPYATSADRARLADQLIAELDEIFACKTLDEWADIFATEPDFFWTPVNTIDDLLADEQFHHGGGLVDVPEESGGTTTMVATPADFLGTPSSPRATAPRLGEHTREILAELGLSPEQIKSLREVDAIT